MGRTVDLVRAEPTSAPAVSPLRVRRSERLVVLAVIMAVLALAGWIGTTVFTQFAAANGARSEDLSARFIAAGPSELGASVKVPVEAGQSAVAFFVGEDLHGVAGTTTGSCTATDADGAPVEFLYSVVLDSTLVNVLAEGKQHKAISAAPVDRTTTLSATCTARDSGVDSFYVVPSDQATFVSTPAWHPWAWFILAGAAAIMFVIGVMRLPNVSDD